MHRKAGRGVGGRAGAQYVCGLRARNLAPCSEPSCIAARAEPAVLREVMRLRPGRPWDPAAPEDLLGPDPAAEQRGALQTRIAAARREIDANTRLLKELFMGDGADDEETVASIRRDNQRLDREIKALGAQLEALPARPELNISTVHALHERLAEADLAGRVQRAYEAGDVPLLRELLAALVQSATIVERTRWGKKVWLRAAVTWTPQVAALIRAGYLLLDEPAEAPGLHSDEEDAAERARRDRARAAERVRRYRARRRAARAKAAPSPSLDGLLTLDQAARELGMTAGGLRSAIARGRLVPVRLAVYPGRAFVAPEELGRYRAEHLGRRGRRQGTTAT
jgi:hypothetical protein